MIFFNIAIWRPSPRKPLQKSKVTMPEQRFVELPKILPSIPWRLYQAIYNASELFRTLKNHILIGISSFVLVERKCGCFIIYSASFDPSTYLFCSFRSINTTFTIKWSRPFSGGDDSGLDEMWQKNTTFSSIEGKTKNDITGSGWYDASSCMDYPIVGIKKISKRVLIRKSSHYYFTERMQRNIEALIAAYDAGKHSSYYSYQTIAGGILRISESESRRL